MIRFTLHRVTSTIPVLFIVTVLTFSLTNVLGGDPLYSLIGEDEVVLTPEAEEQLRHELGLDRPLPVQYLSWLSDALRGDLGQSFQTKESVASAIGDRLPVTLQLAAVAWLFAVVIALPLGIAAAVRRSTWVDHAASSLALAGVATPSFWMGLMLILVVGVWLRLLPPSGFVGVWDSPLQALQYMILPGLTLGVNLIGTIARQTRSGMLEVLGQDYIRTARAKGLRERTVLTKHALRNAMLPVLTVLGLQFANLIGGTVIIEQVFAIPGIGRLAVASVFAQDFPMIQGVVLLAAVATLIGNLLTDIMYSVFDPRIKFD